MAARHESMSSAWGNILQRSEISQTYNFRSCIQAASSRAEATVLLRDFIVTTHLPDSRKRKAATVRRVSNSFRKL